MLTIKFTKRLAYDPTNEVKVFKSSQIKHHNSPKSNHLAAQEGQQGPQLEARHTEQGGDLRASGRTGHRRRPESEHHCVRWPAGRTGAPSGSVVDGGCCRVSGCKPGAELTRIPYFLVRRSLYAWSLFGRVSIYCTIRQKLMTLLLSRQAWGGIGQWPSGCRECFCSF